ncbi:hypothetical protein E4K10_24005 [Streptomyces sp. T1317-0309]|nr:hypothetical protein E4K10_24005 [Streptomyces sp. T1317-0309]
MVLGDLHPAVHLAHRLHRAAHLAVRGPAEGPPAGRPKRLTRLPAYATWRTDADPEQVREAALKVLKRRRFRAHVTGDAVAAEKGYLREAGNLAFHVALIVMLIAFAWGQLYKSEGNKLVVEGDGFSNTLTQYDDFKSGSLFTTTTWCRSASSSTGSPAPTSAAARTRAPRARTRPPSPTAWVRTARTRRPPSGSTSR